MIVDFGHTGGSSYAFAYNWDVPAAPSDPLTSHDMLVAVAAATLFDADITSSEFGAFVSNFTMGSDVGDPGNFWSFSLGEVIDPGVAWTSAPFGIDDRELADGSLDGWYNGFTDTFDAIPPSVPTTQVPAPATLALTGVLALAGRRRRQR